MKPTVGILLWGMLAAVAPLPAQEHRKIMASDAVQSDLVGPVATVEEFEEADGRKVQTEARVYTPQGDLVEEKDYEEGALVSVTRYFYAADGTRERSETRDASGKMLEHEVFTYSVPSRKVVTEVRDGSGALKEKSEMAYSAKGLEVDGKDYDALGELTGAYTVTRGPDGKETLVRFLDAKGRTETEITLLWDAKGYVRKQEMLTLLGEHKGWKTTTESTSVVLDAQGNWISRVEVETHADKRESLPSKRKLLRREITYHPPSA